MSFGGLGHIPPTGVIAGPVNKLGFDTTRVWPEPLAFTKRFPASLQQYSAFQPEGKIVSIFPDGWRSIDWNYVFVKSFAVTKQMFAPNSGSSSAWF